MYILFYDKQFVERVQKIKKGLLDDGGKMTIAIWLYCSIVVAGNNVKTIKKTVVKKVKNGLLKLPWSIQWACPFIKIDDYLLSPYKGICFCKFVLKQIFLFAFYDNLLQKKLKKKTVFFSAYIEHFLVGIE